MTAANPSLQVKSNEPSNPVAERAVIAALVRGGSHEPITQHGITTDLFTIPERKEAFQAVVGFLVEGIRPDAAILESALTPGSQFELESLLEENVSTANLPVHTALLKECRRQRDENAARERLAHAAVAGVPDHELAAIVESVRQTIAGTANKNRFTEAFDLCKSAPSENWLVKNFLPDDSLSILFGVPGCGKSFLAIDIACHVATGRDWRGNPVKQGKVIYIAGEGRNGLAKRFKAWFELNDEHDEQLRNIQLVLSPTALTDPAEIASLVADINALPESPVLVVIDTLNRNFGPGDENSTSDMTRAVAGLDAIRTATGATILGVHHSGHAEKSRGRGSSVLLGAIDAEFSVEKLGGMIQLRSTKMKDADMPKPLAWTLQKQDLPWADSEGVPMNSAILVSADVPLCTASSRRLSAGQKIAMDALRSALIRHGTEENGIVTVSEDEWRKAAYDTGIASSDTTQQAKRKAFLRARLDLVSSHHVHADSGRYWIPAPSGTKQNVPPAETGEKAGFLPSSDHLPPIEGGTKRYKAVHVPECTARQDGSKAVQSGTHPLRGVPSVPPADVPHTEEQEIQQTRSEKPIAERQTKLAVRKCSWNDAGRLVDKCSYPEPNAARTGCATCGAVKLEGVVV